ncbi:MAG: methyltransferase domain-containing protein [bacterium]
MRILHVVQGLYPDCVRGTEVYTYELCRELSKNHDVFIFTVSSKEAPGDSLIEDEKSGNLHIRWIHRPRSFFLPYKVFRKNLGRYIEEIMPDVIHFQHLYSCGYSIPEVIKKRKIPYLISVQDYYYLCPKIRLVNKYKDICDGPGLSSLRSLCCGSCVSGEKSSLIRFMYRTVKFYWWLYRFRKLLNDASLVLAISEYVKAKYLEFGFDSRKIIVNRWGVDLELFQPDTRPEDQTCLNVTYLGGVIHDKGVHILIDSFKKIDGLVKLNIYGDAEEEYIDLLKKKASDSANISFIGRYDHKQIGEILSQTHILVVPSIWEEAYGLVVQEGLAARVPIIASDVGGIKEQIFDGINGFVVKENDIAALANKMQYVVDNYDSIKSQLKYNVALKSLAQNSEVLSQIYEALFRREMRYPVSWQFRNDIDDLAEFFSKERHIIEEAFIREWSNLGSSVRAAWYGAAPETKKQINDFYQSTDSYIYDLIVIHKTWSRTMWRKIAIELFHKYGVETILDFGGGIGEDAIGFKKLGFKPTIYEIGLRTAEFAKWRFSKHNLEIEVITDRKDLGQYNAVYCTEVLEHLTDPVETINLLPHFLTKDGILLVTHSFERLSKRYPSHLKENAVYAKDFIKLVEDAGFVYLDKKELPGNTLYVFQNSNVKSGKGLERMEAISCNLCDNFDSSLAYRVNDIDIVRCKKCGLIYQNPMQKDVKGLYSEDYYDQNYGDKERLSSSARVLIESVSKYVPDNRIKVLEIGSGLGYTLKTARDRGWEVFGTDVSAFAVRYAKEEHGIEIFNGDLDEAGFEDNFFDLVIMSHVLEHLPDPSRFLEKIFHILKKSGVLYIAVPNIDSFKSRMKKEKWHHLQPEHHLYHFSPRTLKKIVLKAGFKIVDMRTPQNIITSEDISKTGVASLSSLAKKLKKIKRYFPFVLDGIRYFIGKFIPGEGITLVAKK